MVSDTVWATGGTYVPPSQYVPVTQGLDYEDCILPRFNPDSDDPLDWPLEDRPLAYVAGYYSANPCHGTHNAVKMFQPLIDAGWVPMVPHASLLLDLLSPHPAEFWYKLDLALLLRCDALFICPDPLTGESIGVNEEIKFALKFDIPIFHQVILARDRYSL